MKKKKILITGLNGVMGWALFRQVQKNHHTYGTFRKRHEVFRKPHFFRVNLDCEDEILAMLESVQPDVLIHSWGMCDLDLCEEMPEMAFRINKDGTERFIRLAERVGSIKKFVYISTDHIFDGARGKYFETDDPRPIHAYGRSKIEAELSVRQSQLSWIIVRPGLVITESAQGNIGPRDFLFARIRAGKPTHYFTDEWRSPITGERFAKRVLELIERDAEGIYHIAGEETVNRFDLAKRLAAGEGLPGRLIFPKLRCEDTWAKIRPHNLSLKTIHS